MAISEKDRIRQFSRVVKTHRIAIPDALSAALAATSPLSIPDPNKTAAAVLAAIGGKNEAKEIDAIIGRHAALTVARQDGIFGRVIDGLDTRALRAIRDNADAIHAATAEALKVHIERLTEAAANVPGTTPVGDRNVRTSLLIQVEAAQTAVAALTDVYSGSRLLYGNIKAPLALVEFPESLTRAQWYAFGLALDGRRQIETSGGTSSTAVFWWAVASDFGATFTLQSVEGARRNSERMQGALTALSIGQHPDEVVSVDALTSAPAVPAAESDSAVVDWNA